MLVLAPKDWSVVSNTTKISKIGSVSGMKNTKVLERFLIDDTTNSEIVSSFGSTKFVCHEFERSKSISTYLYSVIAGPFDVLTPTPG